MYPEKIPGPHRYSAFCEFLNNQVSALENTKTPEQISVDIAYKPSIFPMILNGETWLPIDKMAPLAKALDVEPKYLFRLALQSQWPALALILEDIFGKSIWETSLSE